MSVGVEDVESGLACKCVCPSCGGVLQAKKGDGKVHHFSHDPKNKDECFSGYETSVHLMAKQILEEEGKLNLPMYKVSVSQKDMAGKSHSESEILYEKGSQNLESIVLEQKFDGIRSDIIGYQGTEKFLIEVAVTHFIGKEKKEKIKDLKLRVVEIDLSKINPFITKNDLRKELIEIYDNKKWINHPDSEVVKKMLHHRLSLKVKEINKEIYRKRYAKNESENNKKIKKTINLQKKDTEKKDTGYNSSWLRCDSCSYLWRYADKHIENFVGSVFCPKCGREVSTKSVM